MTQDFIGYGIMAGLVIVILFWGISRAKKNGSKNSNTPRPPIPSENDSIDP